MALNPSKGQYFESPLWKGRYPLTAGYRYSSGTLHAAWDVGTPIGTPILAPVDCTVGDMADGAPNQPPGVPGGPGSPSNWVLLHWNHPGRGHVTLWLQHGNRGVPVRRGQRVKAGQVVLYSGNSGNTYGPHLHAEAITGHRTGTGRWARYSNPSANIFPPSATWEGMSSAPPTEEDDLTPEQAKQLHQVAARLDYLVNQQNVVSRLQRIERHTKKADSRTDYLVNKQRIISRLIYIAQKIGARQP